MNQYKKTGYLHHAFQIFHIKDQVPASFQYHYHDFNKILLFLSGNVSYHIEGKHYSLLPQDIVLLQAGQIHKPVITGNTPYDRIILYVSTDFLNSYKTDSYDLNYCFQKSQKEHSNVFRSNTASMTELMSVIHRLDYAKENPGYAASLYEHVLLLDFLIQLNRMFLSNESNSIRENPASSQTVIDIIQYIQEHLTSDLSIESIASCFFLNRYYLMHLFKQETGYTIGNFITQKRLLNAGTLLLNGYNSTDACFQSGFKNYSTFSRAFKKEFEVSPKQYKNKWNRNL